MLTQSGAKLLDFGLAKPTRPVLGTKLAQLPTMSEEIFYISPENALMAVKVRTEGPFEAGSPTRLIDIPLRRFYPSSLIHMPSHPMANDFS